MTLRTLVLLAPLVLSACAGAGNRPDTEEAPISVAAARQATPVVGSTVVIAGKHARIERLYQAASGRRCLDIVLLDEAPGERIACQDTTGAWSIRRAWLP